MPTVTYISFSGDRHSVDADIGKSVMETAVSNGIPGIDADCGGACACATCHVIVGQEWFERLTPPDDAERSMLEFAVDPQPCSRLSCQLVITEALDGLVVHTPSTQR